MWAKIRVGGPLRFLPFWALVSFNPKGPFQSLQSNLLKQIGAANMWVQSPRPSHRVNIGAQGWEGRWRGDHHPKEQESWQASFGPREMYIYDTLGGRKAPLIYFFYIFFLGQVNPQVVGAEGKPCVYPHDGRDRVVCCLEMRCHWIYSPRSTLNFNIITELNAIFPKVR